MFRSRSEFAAIEKRIGYRFRDRELLRAALTHRSFRFENEGVGADNQRLEFLGDAVLGFVAALHLYERYPEHEEGALTAMRSRLTSGKALAAVAAEADLGAHLRIGKGEERSGGRARASNLTDCLEAIIGAACLDGGLKAASRVFQALFVARERAMEHDKWAGNPKGLLQQTAQERFKVPPIYRVVDRDGPAHRARFQVEVLINDRVAGAGGGPSKQDAERAAAVEALRSMGIDTAGVIE